MFFELEVQTIAATPGLHDLKVFSNLRDAMILGFELN